MRKLIEITQEYLIVCDNCDYKIPNETKDPNLSCEDYINKPCPQCGENLLTEKDYNDDKTVMCIVNWMNNWFSWLTIFIPKKKYKSKANIKVHKGINIKYVK